MVKLYGVVHGLQLSDVLGLESRQVLVAPSLDFLYDLSQMKTGARIGVEWFEPSLNNRIEAHLEDLICKTNINAPAHYAEENKEYWEEIVYVCRQAGHSIVFLEENEEVWQRCNQAIIEYQTCRERLHALDTEECPRNQFKLTMQLKEDVHKAQLRVRKVHELERDELLLNAISSIKVDAAIVGLAHSEHWYARKDVIKSIRGIEFESYATDIVDGARSHLSMGMPKVTSRFTKEAVPNEQYTFERESVERAIRIVESQSVTGRKPNFVGTWDLTNPSKGLFEVFVEKNQDGRFRGTIEDYLGTATFDGEKTATELTFKKCYNLHRSSKDAVKEPILYKGRISNGECEGVFNVYGLSEPFYMTETSKADPTHLSLSWFDMQQDNRTGQHRLF